MPDWDHIGWWRNAHHERELRKSQGPILARIMAKHRRQRMIESVLVTTASILFAVAIVGGVVLSVSYYSTPPPKPAKSSYYEERPISISRSERFDGCPR